MSTTFTNKDGIKVVIKPGNRSRDDMSSLEKERLNYHPRLPDVLANPKKIQVYNIIYPSFNAILLLLFSL